MLLELFLLFFVIGAVSFGGGYAMIPIIEREVTQRGWLTTSEFTDFVGLAGMAPGSIASNSATSVGYHIGGIYGALISSLAITLPSLIFILVMAKNYEKVKDHPLITSAFYGLRPIVTSLIIYAAINFALSNGVIAFDFSTKMLRMFIIFAVSLCSLLFLKLHPSIVIIMAGILGIFVFR
ncbi:chromate transporter [Neobacillus niacini]|uniref:chromate transporter n=1 Tax=Neobacillus niacini TaxID=86668 RepID=UPI0028594F50|nr:chromate transporter [Neobacillus niacini]MDR7001065.1 chromate transporter [Neobacillus niacini]